MRSWRPLDSDPCRLHALPARSQTRCGVRASVPTAIPGTNAGVTGYGMNGSLEITGMQLSLTDTGAQPATPTPMLDSGETGVLHHIARAEWATAGADS